MRVRLHESLSWLVRLHQRMPLVPLLIQAVDPNATSISAFFTRLSADLTAFCIALAVFCLLLAALFLMVANATGNERARTHAIGSLYGVLGALAVALLANILASLINNAVTGASAGGPGQ